MLGGLIWAGRFLFMSVVSNEPRSEPSGVLYSAEHGRAFSRYTNSVFTAQTGWWRWRWRRRWMRRGVDLISLCAVFYWEPWRCRMEGPCVTAAVGELTLLTQRWRINRDGEYGGRERRRGGGGEGGMYKKGKCWGRGWRQLFHYSGHKKKKQAHKANGRWMMGAYVSVWQQWGSVSLQLSYLVFGCSHTVSLL